MFYALRSGVWVLCVTQGHDKNGGKNADADGKQQKDDPCEYAGLSALNKPLVGHTVVKEDIAHDNRQKYGTHKHEAVNGKLGDPRFLRW